MSTSRVNEVLINLSNISRKYKDGSNEITVLQDLSFQLTKGEFVGIVGKSGTGKSTLLNILALLDQEYEGDYSCCGHPMKQLKSKAQTELRLASLSYITQVPALIGEYSVLDNVALPLLYRGEKKLIRDKKALENLKKVGLYDYAQRLPEQLSGGQKQRVAIARALSTETQIIIADEPTGSLDPASAQNIMELLQDLNHDGHSIIMVTHDFDLLRYCSRTLLLDHGRLVNYT